MTERWTDERLDAALTALGADLEVPEPAQLDIPSVTVARRSRRRWIVAAVAVGLLVIAGALVITPARETVARWFGLEIERGEGRPAVTATFADDVAPLDLDIAVARSGLDAEALGATTLGAPDGAGIPPEGGVVFLWDRGDTTLWIKPGDEGVVVVKQLFGNAQAEIVEGLGDYGMVIDDAHLLETPARRVAARHVLWWLDGDDELRLESDLDTATMIAIGRSLAAG